MQSEVLALERRHLDLEAGTLRLDPGTTKNDDGRVVYLPPECKRLLAAQLERVHQVERRLGRIIPYLFPHLRGTKTRRPGTRGPVLGERIQDFQKTWERARAAAGLRGTLRHDFRRSAVRNMVNRGIPERVAMMISGHRTRSVFDRYHIVSPGDLREAARRLTGTTTGTTGRDAIDTDQGKS
jgi:integrase